MHGTRIKKDNRGVYEQKQCYARGIRNKQRMDQSEKDIKMS